MISTLDRSESGTDPAPASSTRTLPANPKRDLRRFVCVHGHFYQPPRENPWLETVEPQSSAAPYHDWNDRITAECYAPNGASRITDRDGDIIRISNNYARMSFNFGATLLSWLKDNAPRAYRMILDADKASAVRFSGHGSALAQVYNHIIMPLASERDARTQIRWGIRDFESRFGRKPEGMWLAETAVDRRTLDLLAQEGIRFTVLAPHQCLHVRKLAARPVILSGAPAESAVEGPPHCAPADSSGDPEPTKLEAWIPTPNATVNTTHPYRVPLDDGRSIDVFFYNGPASRAIAFEGLLNSGETFGQSLVKHLGPAHSDLPAQLSHVATDGESYGHHHKHGDMALSYAMHWVEDKERATLTNYGEFLELFPPEWEAEVVEDSSWSCSHGVERWRSDCGCNGGKPGWNQRWRRPLREALDHLRDAIVPLAEAKAAPLLRDLWDARNQYIHIILDRSNFNKDRFLVQHARKSLSFAERTTVWELLELQRQSQLMYTSCGWFFDEISGIETVQIIAYAARVLQLAGCLFGTEVGNRLEAEFLAKLAQAESNVPGEGTGADVYRRAVAGLRIGLLEVGAHYAISSVFRAYPDTGALFCFDIRRESHEVLASGRGKVALGRAQIRSRITEETQTMSYAVLHLGDQNLSAAVKRSEPANAEELATFQVFSADVARAIKRANLPEVIRLIDRTFHGITYSLNSLFADEQTRITRTILDQTLSEVEDSLRKIYEDHASLLHFLTESGVPVPAALALAANFATNASLRAAIEADLFNTVEVETLLNRAKQDHITLDTVTLAFAAGQRMKRAMVALETSASVGGSVGIVALQNALLIADSLRTFPFEVTLWGAQNIWNDLLRRADTRVWSPEWRDGFRKLGLSLSISVDHLVIEEGVPTF